MEISNQVLKSVRHLVSTSIVKPLRKKYGLFTNPLGIKKYKIAASKLGTDYGGWIVPDGVLDEKSVCYLAGAGEDISFDVEIVKRFKTDVFIFDPTPKAKNHFDTFVEKTKLGQKFSINNSSQHFYIFDSQLLPKLHFVNEGIWNVETTLKFYSPENPDHVSHSVKNLQKTQRFFEAKVKPLQSIMQTLGHNKIDLLKIDIEGAEYEVIDSIIENKIKPTVLCIEFHLLEKGKEQILESVKKLERFGLLPVATDEHFNVTFAAKELLKL